MKLLLKNSQTIQKIYHFPHLPWDFLVSHIYEKQKLSYCTKEFPSLSTKSAFTERLQNTFVRIKESSDWFAALIPFEAVFIFLVISVSRMNMKRITTITVIYLVNIQTNRIPPKILFANQTLTFSWAQQFFGILPYHKTKFHKWTLQGHIKHKPWTFINMLILLPAAFFGDKSQQISGEGFPEDIRTAFSSLFGSVLPSLLNLWKIQAI